MLPMKLFLCLLIWTSSLRAGLCEENDALSDMIFQTNYLQAHGRQSRVSEKLGFNKIPSAFLQHQSTKIPILTRPNFGADGVMAFFVPPAMSFVPGSATTFNNIISGKYDITFGVKIIDRKLEELATKLVKIDTNRTKVSVKTLPTIKYRLKNITELANYFSIPKYWTTNNQFNEVVNLKFRCSSKEHCSALHTNLNQDPNTIFSSFAVETVIGVVEGELASYAQTATDESNSFTWKIKPQMNIGPADLKWKVVPVLPNINPDTLGSVTPINRTEHCGELHYDHGWCLFQMHRKTNPTDKFMNKTWVEYKYGFGDLGHAAYWAGLENVRALTANGRNRLRIEWPDSKGKLGYIEYDGFRLGTEQDGYRLYLGRKTSGTVRDIFPEKCSNNWNNMNTRSVGFPFAAPGNDRFGTNCERVLTGSRGIAAQLGAGWWMCSSHDSTTLNRYDNQICNCDGCQYGNCGHLVLCIYPDVVKMFVK